MEIVGHKYKRAIYAFEFDDKSVYVGLTFNYQKRHRDHLAEGPVSRKLKSNIGKFKKFDIWYSPEQAKLQEALKIKQYQNKNWTILNKQKPGGLGGINVIWTKENCILEAKKYNSRSNLQKNAIGCYSSLLKNGWIDEACKHMRLLKKKNGYWTLGLCRLEALKYKTRVNFSIGSPSAYKTATKNQWIDSICKHMKNKKQKPKNYWTKEKCRIAAKLYKTRTNFYKHTPRGYVVSKNNGWLDEFFDK